MSVCAVVAADPVHEEMSWLNAEADSKHIIHSSHFRCVPTPNVLVERRSGIKHTIHISHLRCVPTPNVLVERRSGRKHIIHIVTCAVFQLPMSWLNAEANETYIPYQSLARFPTSKCRRRMYFYRKALRCTSTPSTHIFHQTRVPIRHRPVVITRRPRRALSSNFGA